MMDIAVIQEYSKELIASGVLLVVLILLRVGATKLVLRYAKTNHTLEHRSTLIVKYMHLFLYILAIIALIIIWGVQPKDIILAMSSITTVVGVALIAQWSILSNITSGIILFFSFPFKIGDVIKIHDKDFPFIGEIIDIGAFHIFLRTEDGEEVIYPNNLLLQKGISIMKDHFNDKEFVD